LFITILLGSLGIILIIKFSNYQILKKISAKSNLRIILGTVILMNIILIFYFILHQFLILKILINSKIIEPNLGSGEGYFWTENLVNESFRQSKIDSYKFFNFLKDFIFVILNIGLFAFSIFQYKKFNLKTKEQTNQKKPNLIVTIVLFIISLFLSFLGLGITLIATEEFQIWEMN
jgi:accessory gene regulator protein AgrB